MHWGPHVLHSPHGLSKTDTQRQFWDIFGDRWIVNTGLEDFESSGETWSGQKMVIELLHKSWMRPRLEVSPGYRFGLQAVCDHHACCRRSEGCG